MDKLTLRAAPHFLQTLKRDLLACLERDGFSSVSEAVGADFR